MKYPLILGLMIFYVMSGWTQSSKKVPYDSTLEKSELRIGLRFTSDYFFMGRRDSVAAPYLTPSVAYYHRSGFFGRSSLSYLTAKDQGRIDMISFTGGYDYYGKKLAVGASISEYMFSDESYVVPAEMSTYLNTYAGYDFSAIMLFADASVGFSDGADFFLTMDLSRMFYTLNNRLIFLPSFSVNMGTQKYYDQYYEYRSPQSGFGPGYGKGKNGSGSQPTVVVSIEESDKFQILDYEASLQITYKLDKLRIFSYGVWTLPVNPATVVVDGVSTEESLQNGFYWSMGVRYSISMR